MFAPLSPYIFGQSSYFRNFIARSAWRREAKVVLARDAAAAKSGKERGKKGIPVLDYQNTAQSPLGLIQTNWSLHDTARGSGRLARMAAHLGDGCKEMKWQSYPL